MCFTFGCVFLSRVFVNTASYLDELQENAYNLISSKLVMQQQFLFTHVIVFYCGAVMVNMNEL